jgi:hypothetical protein
MSRYPALRERSSNSVAAVDSFNHLTDNLRELAAAANAMQGDNVTIGRHSSHGAVSTHLPAHVIKTVGPNGWEVIENAEQWGDLLRRRSLEVWADGIVNMIVELADVPVPSATGGKGQL